MARFAGLVGFAHSVKTAPGVTREVITEREYFGDVKRAAVNAQYMQTVNPDIRTQNSIEIVADDYVSENIFAIRFVEWAGVTWMVTEVAVQRPRLILRLGGVYHGDRAKAL